MLQRTSLARRQFVAGCTRSAGADCQTNDTVGEKDSLPSCWHFRNLGNVDEIYLNAWLVKPSGLLSRGKSNVHTSTHHAVHLCFSDVAGPGSGRKAADRHGESRLRGKPPWFKDSFLDIREDLEEATTVGKRLILCFYQDGCRYCTRLLKNNFGNREIAQKTQQHFEVIAINMWGDREVT